MQEALANVHKHAPGGQVRVEVCYGADAVTVAVINTAATADQLRAAVQAGAKTSTHLGNGSHAILPRHPNYIWEQLASDELYAGVIADGHHLPASVVKAFARVKGPEDFPFRRWRSGPARVLAPAGQLRRSRVSQKTARRFWPVR